MNERKNVLHNGRSGPKRKEERDRWEKGRDLEIEWRKWKEGKGKERQGEGRNMIEIEGK